MFVTTLLHIAADQVTTYISEKRLPKPVYPLENKLSNLIFDKLVCQKAQYRRSFAKHMRVTKVDLRGIDATEADVKFLANLNLESLTLKKLNTLDSTLGESNGFIRIHELLPKMLNPISQGQLRHLDLKGAAGQQRFTEGWSDYVVKNLVSLEILVLTSRHLFDSDFKTLCHGLPKLQILDVAHTKISTLEGISKLKNLQVLAIGGLCFSEYEQMNDVFGLKELKVLDLACRKHDRWSNRNLLSQFLECNGVLPKLRFVDCAGEEISFGMIKKLIGTHTTLQKVSVIDTIIATSNYFGVELLNTHTLENACRALRHYAPIKNIVIACDILDVVAQGLNDHIYAQTDENVQMLLETICHILENGQRSPLLTNAALNCLARFLEEEPLLTSIPKKVLLRVMHALLKVCSVHIDWEQSNPQYARIHEVAWWILKRRQLLVPSGIDLKHIFDRASDYMRRRNVTSLERRCRKAMTNSFEAMSPKERKELFKDQKIWTKVLYGLDVHYINRNDVMYQHLLGFILSLADNSLHTLTAVGGARILARHLKTNADIRLLKIFKKIASSALFRKELCKSYNLEEFREALMVLLESSTDIPAFHEKVYMMATILSTLISKETGLTLEISDLVTKVMTSISYLRPVKTSDLSLGEVMNMMNVSPWDGPIHWALWTIMQKIEKREIVVKEMEERQRSKLLGVVEDAMERTSSVELKKFAANVLKIFEYE